MAVSRTDEKSMLESQVAVIGCLLIDSSTQGEIFARVDESDFTSETYRHIYAACREVFFSGRPLDAVTAAEAAGNEYRRTIVEIIGATPTAVNWATYVDLIREQSVLVRLHDVGRQLYGAASVSEAQELIGKAYTSLNSRRSVRPVTMAEALTDFYNRQTDKEGAKYLSWGFAALDATIHCRAGYMVILGGRPSSGKTMLALDFAQHMAKERRTAFFSLETDVDGLFDRLAARLYDLSFGKIMERRLTEQELDEVTGGSGQVIRRKLELIPAAGMSVADIQSLTLAGRYDVIFIDYLQLIRSAGNTQVERVSNISRGLQTLAKTHGVVVVALSQLSRAERGVNKAPSLDDLRDSGQIEQDADVVLLIYPEYKNEPNSPRRLMIAKNKEGELKYMTLRFDGDKQRFFQTISNQSAPAQQSAFKPLPDKLHDPQIDLWERENRAGG